MSVPGKGSGKVVLMRTKDGKKALRLRAEEQKKGPRYEVRKKISRGEGEH